MLHVRTHFFYKALRFILGVVLSVLLVLLIAIGAALLLEDKIKQSLISAINEELTVPVNVSGRIRFSFIEHFPQASLSFPNVSVPDKLNTNSRLAEVEQLSILFNPLDLIKKQISIQGIFIQNGLLQVVINEKGETNLAILRPTQKTTSDSPHLNIRQINLRNIRISYLDKKNSLSATGRCRKLDLEGNVAAKNFPLNIKGDFFAEQCTYENNTLLSNREMSVDISLLINDLWKKILFNQSSIKIAENKFLISGNLDFTKQFSSINLSARTSGTDIRKLIGLLPPLMRSKYSDFNGKAAYEFYLTAKGEINNRSAPALQAILKVNNGWLQLPGSDIKAENVFLEAEYQNNNGYDHLHIKDCRAQIDGHRFLFSLLLKNLKHPSFTINA
ncbi:MAG: AsmA family protein, partial [Chitinophagales bacterium]|nr:AsmA family protein [Chitinophagales bacterium]